MPCPHLRFLDLPRNVRDKVYSELLTFCGENNEVHTTILRTNRQINDEATPLLYELNTPTVTIQENCLIFGKARYDLMSMRTWDLQHGFRYNTRWGFDHFRNRYVEWDHPLPTHRIGHLNIIVREADMWFLPLISPISSDHRFIEEMNGRLHANLRWFHKEVLRKSTSFKRATVSFAFLELNEQEKDLWGPRPIEYKFMVNLHMLVGFKAMTRAAGNVLNDNGETLGCQYIVTPRRSP